MQCNMCHDKLQETKCLCNCSQSLIKRDTNPAWSCLEAEMYTLHAQRVLQLFVAQVQLAVLHHLT